MCILQGWIYILLSFGLMNDTGTSDRCYSWVMSMRNTISSVETMPIVLIDENCHSWLWLHVFMKQMFLKFYDTSWSGGVSFVRICPHYEFHAHSTLDWLSGSENELFYFHPWSQTQGGWVTMNLWSSGNQEGRKVIPFGRPHQLVPRSQKHFRYV